MIYQINVAYSMREYKRIKCFEIVIYSKPLEEENEKSIWKTIIKEKSEEKMKREIQQKPTTMKNLRFLWGAHINESQYVIDIWWHGGNN